MARVSRVAVMLEVTHTGINLCGVIPDTDYTPEGNHSSSLAKHSKNIESAAHQHVLQFAPSAVVNAAGVDASFQGLSCVMSRQTVESVMIMLGFQVTRVLLSEHPTSDEDVRTYTGPKGFTELPRRYFLRCTRSLSEGIENPADQSNPKKAVLSLEDAVVSGQRAALRSWEKIPRDWHSFHHPEAKDSHYSAYPIEIWTPCGTAAAWVFDRSVALRFEREARCHIPDYEAIVELSLQLLENEVDKQGKDRYPVEIPSKASFKVVDIGCATGFTLKELCRRGFTNIHGVDIAKPMLSRAESILTTVIDSNKMSQGVTQEEIDEKEIKPRGVLRPLPVAWYFQVLQEECCFSDVSIISAKFCFVTFVARRDERIIPPTPMPLQNLSPHQLGQRSFIHWDDVESVANNISYQEVANFHLQAWTSSKTEGWEGGTESDSTFGFVQAGKAVLTRANGHTFTLYKGMYFSRPGRLNIEGGCGIAVVAHNHQALFSMGGPVNPGETGRLPY